MPNPLHAMVWMVADDMTPAPRVGATGRAPLPKTPRRGPAPRSLGSLIAGFKSAATKRINALRGTPGIPVWQRNYYEHIIGDETALQSIRRYIAQNPLRWHLDRYNPDAVAPDPYEREIRCILEMPREANSSIESRELP